MTSKPRLKASTLSLVVLGALSLQGCATKQAWIPELEAATTTYQEISQDPVVSALAAEELSLAEFQLQICLLYTSPSPRDKRQSRMPSSA